jgi:p-methyltransferase
MATLDCVVIGYNSGEFADYRAMCERAGADSPEMQIYRKEYLNAGGQQVSWMDAFSMIRAEATGARHRYHVGEVYNLAALYLTSNLRRHGVRTEPVSLFDAERDHLADLLAQRPAVVAVTTTFYVNILPVLPVVEFVREHSPESHIVVGGPLIDNLCRDGIGAQTQDFLDAMGADSYVQESQGEGALVDLCHALSANDDLTKVDNLILHQDGRWAITRRRPESNDLDACSIDWSGFDPAMIGPTAQMRTARSCAFKCAFCDYPSRAGALTAASIDTVRRELRQMAELGVRHVVFVDDTFNVPPKRFKQLCQMMIDEDLGLAWYSYFRCSNARDDEAFDLAAASGCKGVFLGIESGDDTVLKAMQKKAQDDQYRHGIRRLKERGITTFASVLVGFPTETEQTVSNTVAFLNETAPDFWRAQTWWANPRSPVFLNAPLYGIKGEGYHWSHRTMTSAEAAAQADVMFDAVTESIWLPLYDFDFWSLPFLRGKGVETEDLKPLLRISQRIMSERDRGAPPAALDLLEKQFAAAAAGLDLAPARFTL